MPQAVALSLFLQLVRRSVTVVVVTPLIGDHVHVEQWQLNAAVHFNEWANLHANDFSPVVDAYKALVKQFHCGDCHSIVAVTPDHGDVQNLRCACGKININLVKK
jgi:hypothetical protein